ncbi:MAG: sulfotransferase family 2 domain-containing protein, partial [Betaproteobacteria bacterium]|nr:sulfotransferase family 2 domain-containing protein [Betaproteobacteria bacterium]
MVLSDTRKFLFIHIPKTAGTSIQHVLEPYGVTDFLAYSRGIERYLSVKRQFPAHLRYADAAAMLTVDLSRFFKFTFVRNPWDRYVSLYEYFRRDAKHAMHQRCMSCSFQD